MSEQDTDAPALRLSGLELEGGWVVGRRQERTSAQTGGNFSIGYVVEHQDGRRAFLKALDFSAALAQPDPTAALEMLTTAFNFERSILELCRGCSMSRIVTPFQSGELVVPGGGALARVSYLLFDLAEGDVRSWLQGKTEAFGLGWRLRTLQQVATGLKQLHTQLIAHQDLKPSNVLMFAETDSKIADLGRAVDRAGTSPFAQLLIAGDYGYAPPELMYGFQPADWNAHRLACDMYQLGSLLLFFVSTVNMTPMLLSALPLKARPEAWQGDYSSVLPFMQDAFGLVLERFDSDVQDLIPRDAARLTETLRYLCQPDPTRRGHPKTRSGVGSPYKLDRFVSTFDLLASRAESDSIPTKP